jgi:hypothetical protein
VMHLVGLSTQ